MSQEQAAPKSEGESKEPAPKKKRKGLFLGGGILGLAATAYALALVAVPKHAEDHALTGPFAADLSQDQYRVNLAQDGGRHYLAISLKAEVDAYEETYTGLRVADPLYQARLTDAVIRIASEKSKKELDKEAGREVFRDELRKAIEPILFPLHLGDPHAFGGQDEESGLAFGISASESTLRGLFFDHVVAVDAPHKTLRLDGGEATAFQGNEPDIELHDAQGATLYLDVTRLHPDFVGEVHVGVMGKVRSIYFSTFLTQ
jgi:flagellar basal body-associated protein FliL